jgi:hypothetical protein
MMQHLAERQPRIVLQRAEKIFPTLKESLVSFLCLNAQKPVFLSCSLYLQHRKVSYLLALLMRHHEGVLWSGNITTPFLTLSLQGGELFLYLSRRKYVQSSCY